jgi:hypothetical protein
MSKNHQSSSPFHAILLEPILTPSAIVDNPVDETPDVDDFDLDPSADDFEVGDSARAAIAFDADDFEVLNFASPTEPNYTGGVFTVGEDGTVGIDFLFDGGAYRRGEVGIFSLDGLDPNSEDFIQLAAERALSNSEQGYVVISDATDGARFSGTMREADFNAGEYRGVREFEMKAGDRFGIMLASNHSIEEVANGKIENVRFSMATDSLDDDFYFGQIADVTGDGNTFAFEDVTLDQSDQDYNDIVFQVRGATAETALMDDVVAEGRDWRTHNMGQALIEYANAYTDTVDYTAAQFEAAREFQPLVGVIDTGVDVDAIGLDAGDILTGSDFVDGDDNPLLATGEGDDHGTQVVDRINAINDDAPLWVGRAVGSGRWAESLVEFVDAAVESEQPNAVVNLSFDLTQIDDDGNITTRTEFTPMEMAALEYARHNDVLVVAASGNQGALMSALGQASERFDNIITVGAAEQIDPNASNWQGYDRASYSSYGQGLDILANGGNGSSMAAAQVTGAIAQVWAVNPDLSYQQAIAILKQTATDLGDANPDLATGAGLLNVAAAVHLAKTMKAEEYEKELQRISLSWSGKDDFEASERAANPGAIGSGTGQSATGSQSPMSWRSFLNIFNNPTSVRFLGFLEDVFGNIFGKPPVKTQPAANDFNGDGKSDILWHSETHDNTAIWFGDNGAGDLANEQALQLFNQEVNGQNTGKWDYAKAQGFKVVGVGDFNADGHSDILWQGEALNQTAIWFGNSTINQNGHIQQNKFIGDPTNGMKIAGVGDFNGDGRSDILWQHPETKKHYIWHFHEDLSTSSRQLRTTDQDHEESWSIKGVGDFNDDGYSDVLWHSPEYDGNTAIWFGDNLQGQSFQNEQLLIGTIGPKPPGKPSYGMTIAGVGDFNGDGYSDILWQGEGDNQTGIWLGSDSLDEDGYITDIPLLTNPTHGRDIVGVGDFNGDGISDVLWQHPETRENNIWHFNEDGSIAERQIRTELNADWEIVPNSDSGRYYPELVSLSDSEWDLQTGDNTQFGDVVWPGYGEVDESYKTLSSVHQIYTDLSNDIFGTRYQMTAGYLYDKSYALGTKRHTGIDIGAPAESVVNTLVGGTTKLIQATEGNYFVGVDGDDGNLWIYGHLHDYKQFINIGQRVEPGMPVGTIMKVASHLHLEVQPGYNYKPTYGAVSNSNLQFAKDSTISPLQAYWRWKNT